MKDKRDITWNEIETLCRKLAKDIKEKYNPDVLIGISRGGAVVATMLSHLLNCDVAIVSTKRYHDNKTKGNKYQTRHDITFFRDFKEEEAILIVDDIYDKGETLNLTMEWIKEALPHNYIGCAALYARKHENINNIKFYGELLIGSLWIKFPWEITR